MKFIAAIVLSVLVAALLTTVSAVRADDAPAATTPAGDTTKPAADPATTPSATATTEAPKTSTTTTEPAKTGPATTEPAKDPVKVDPVKTEPVKTEPAKTEPTKAPTATDTPRIPPPPPSLYEQKLVKLEADVAKAKEELGKIPAIETKVNEVIGNLTDSAKKPVDLRVIQQELAERRPSQAANEYKKLQMGLAAAYEKVKGELLGAIKASTELDKMPTKDEALKGRNEDLRTGATTACVEVLTKLVAIYERIGEAKQVENTYRLILALDKNNGAAVAYFKEQEARKKNPNKSEDSGGGSYSSGGRPSRGY
jgi:hypothetical protein